MNLISRKSGGLLGTVIFLSVIVFTQTGRAQSPVSLTVDIAHPGYLIPSDFSGLSIETGSLRSGNAGTYGNWLDDSTQQPAVLHQQMMTLFRNLGIRNIRVGGGSVDQNNVVPSNGDIDAFFRFVKATNLSVIYSLRLLYGNVTQDTDIAKYVYNNYSQFLQTFAIGNEPDWPSYRDSTKLITGYPSYMSQWKLFQSAVHTALPDAKFGGPDQGSNYPIPGARNTDYNGIPWDVNFMNDTKNLGDVTGIYLHNYVGQGASGTPQGMADAMLSATWDNTYYPGLYNADCAPVLAAGLQYRLTESNSFSGSLTGGSTSYATSLFALDYMYWWAAHDASGVNFHNKQWVLNDTFYMDSNGNYVVHPMGYGIAAFNIGGHGRVDSVAISNPNGLDLTAYAVQDTGGNVFVTILNKEHITTAPFAAAPRNAEVSISASGLPDTASVMYLTAPGNNVLAQSGMTLGHETITNDKPFVGKWSPIDTVRRGYYTLRLPFATAAIVRLGGPFETVQAPSLSGPSGVSGVPRQTTLTWKSTGATSGYEVQVASDGAFDSVIYDTTVSAADTSAQLSNPLNADTKYYWHVMALDSLYTSAYSAADSFTTGTGLLSVISNAGVPRKFSLGQNYPNPFNPSTDITFSLDRPGDMSLDIYNILGQLVNRVASGYKSAGSYSYDVNMDAFASGVYFYTLRQGANVITRKMLLLK